MLAARRALPRFCGWNQNRSTGKWRVRFRRGGFSCYLPMPDAPDFAAAYAAAIANSTTPQTLGAARTIAGSIDASIVSYYKLVFPRLKPSTQVMRRNILERFRAKHGDKPVNQLEHRHIDDIIVEMAKTPHAANNLLKVLRHLLEHAIDINLIKSNPALRVKKLKTTGDGVHTWTEDEVIQFEARHPIGTAPYLALHSLLDTGQRKSDAVRMGWQHVRNGKIAVRQEKTDTPLLIPIAPELAQALASVPRTNMTFLLTARGAPFTAAGFGNWFRDRCDEARLPQCSAQGLRKLAATRLANAGCSEREIMAITGHKSVSEVSRYVRARDQEQLAERAMARTKLSTIATPDCPPNKKINNIK
jgi:integrase